MAHVIAVAGKGGVSKTTLAGLLIQYLVQATKNPILAVDADANSNLNEVSGVEMSITLGQVREELERAGRIAELVNESNMNPAHMGLIVNRAPEGKLNKGTLEEIEKQGLELLGIVPQDDMVYQYDCAGKPMVKSPENSPVKNALKDIIEKLVI